MHREHLDHWHSREQHVFVADVGVGVSDNYHQWFSSITLPHLTRIGGGHSYTMDLLDLIDSVYKGEKVGDVLAITARARHVLHEKFSLGYYQDLLVEDRRAKENELKGKSRQVGKKGGPGVVNVPRIRGKLPAIRVVDEGVHLGDEGDGHLGDDEVHLDDGGCIPIGNKYTFVQEDDVGRSDIDLDARERSFCPRWNLLPPNDSLLLSPPDEHVVDQTPPFHNLLLIYSHSLPRIQCISLQLKRQCNSKQHISYCPSQQHMSQCTTQHNSNYRCSSRRSISQRKSCQCSVSRRISS